MRVRRLDFLQRSSPADAFALTARLSLSVKLARAHFRQQKWTLLIWRAERGYLLRLAIVFIAAFRSMDPIAQRMKSPTQKRKNARRCRTRWLYQSIAGLLIAIANVPQSGIRFI